MGVNKSISSIGSRNHQKFTLNVQETSTENNDSLLAFSFVISPIQNGWDWYGWGDKISYSINIGGNVYTGTIPSYDGSSTVTLRSESGIRIPHDADGTKTISIGFSVTDNTGQSYTSGDASKSDILKLTDLHKPPVVAIGNVTELNTKLTNIGISADTFVTQLSKKSIPISATLYDNATVKSYKVINGSVELTQTTQPIVIDYSNTKLDYKYDESLKKNIATFIFGVLDSKSGYSAVSKQYSRIILYDKPNLIPTASSVKRNGQLTGKVKMNLTGTFYNASVGNVKNTISLSYKYWKSSDPEPSTYFQIPSTAYSVSGNNITMNDWEVAKNSTQITDVDRGSTYQFKIKAVDSFGSTSEISLICSKGVWLMAKFKDRVDFQKITINGRDPFEYSETETIIGKWIDGKPLYQKVLKITSTVNSDNTDFAHNIENVDLIFIKEAFVNQTQGDYNGWTYPIPVTLYMSNTEEDKLSVAASRWGVRFYVQTSWGTAWIKYVVLNYTKTTDEAVY